MPAGTCIMLMCTAFFLMACAQHASRFLWLNHSGLLKQKIRSTGIRDNDLGNKRLNSNSLNLLKSRLSIVKNNLNYHSNNIQIEGKKKKGRKQNHNKPNLTFI